MKLDHIAVTQPTGYGLPVGQYRIRAELCDEPPTVWRLQFQMAWYQSAECRRLCSDLQIDGNSIYIHTNDARHIPEAVKALKSLMADMDMTSHAALQPRKKAVI